LNGVVSRYGSVSPLFASALHVDAGGAVRVALTGGLGIATVCDVDRVLRRAHAALVILDLRGLSFMDCAGLRMVLDAHARLTEAGGRLIVVHGPSQVRRVFELTGTSGRLELVSDPADTLDATGRAREASAAFVAVDAH
jgi:anti-sigma B factor antagonist